MSFSLPKLVSIYRSTEFQFTESLSFNLPNHWVLIYRIPKFQFTELLSFNLPNHWVSIYQIQFNLPQFGQKNRAFGAKDVFKASIFPIYFQVPRFRLFRVSFFFSLSFFSLFFSKYVFLKKHIVQNLKPKKSAVKIVTLVWQQKLVSISHALTGVM